MFFGRNKLQVNVYINYGNDEINHHKVKVSPETTVMDVLESVAEIDFFPDESASGHEGSMVISIDGVRSDMSNCWIYYVFERDRPGWRLPRDMPDKVKVTDSMMIGWRYYDYNSKGLIPKEGPLWTNQCINKIKTCAHKFS
jgi:hypothetical protein